MDASSTNWAWPWWTVIVMINVVNLILCAVVYRRSLKPKDGSDPAYRNRMRVMGVIFTLVAAYRAVFVSRYVAQLAWFDSLANSSLLIRLFAVAAELSFSGLIALTMLRVNDDLPAAGAKNANKSKSFMTTKTPYVLMICIRDSHQKHSVFSVPPWFRLGFFGTLLVPAYRSVGSCRLPATILPWVLNHPQRRLRHPQQQKPTF